MKKTFILLFLAALLFCTACQSTEAGKVSLPEESIDTAFILQNENIDSAQVYKEFVMPEPFGNTGENTGGWTYEYLQPCKMKFDGIPNYLSNGIDIDNVAYRQWAESLYGFHVPPTRLVEYMNLYSFFIEFDIPLDEARALMEVPNQKMMESGIWDEELHLNSIDLDILFSMNEAAIIEHFKTDYTISKGDKLYSPQWIYENSVVDYVAEGLTVLDIAPKYEYYEKIGFAQAAIETFEAKLEYFEEIQKAEGVILPEEMTIKSKSIESIGEITNALDADIPQPLVEAVGGFANIGFLSPFNEKINVVSSDIVFAFVTRDEINAWISDEIVYEEISGLSDYHNIYSFMRDFNISGEEAKEVFINTYNESISLGLEPNLTLEDIDIICSMDEQAIIEHFANPYAIVESNNVYTPLWIYNHTADDYLDAGISAEALNEKLALYADFNFTPEAEIYLNEKLSDFIGEEVNISAHR